MLASVTRGCGSRAPGGIYLVTALTDHGILLERLVVDPPLPVEQAYLGASYQGMTLGYDGGDRPVVLDWVGAEGYPNVADFVEEGALFGFSRRIPRSFDFKALGRDARHVLIHPRAVVTNPLWLLENPGGDGDGRPLLSFLTRAKGRTGASFCPFDQRHEADGPAGGMCASLWWECLLPNTVTHDPDPDRMEREVQRLDFVPREMPAFTYAGYCLPDRDVYKPGFAPGVFLRLPITRIEVVTDPEDKTHEPALDKASKSGLPVLEVDE